MTRRTVVCTLALIVVIWLGGLVLTAQEVKPAAAQAQAKAGERIALPAAAREGGMALHEALARRRSIREYTDKVLSERELAQLLWAAQGVNRPDGHRTAPSAMARYPLELYVATPSGFFHYQPREHQLERRGGDLRSAISKAARGQKQILQSPGVFVFTAVFERMGAKPDDPRAARWIYVEAGHAAQNLLLEAVALGFAGVPMGGFDDKQLQEGLPLPADHRPVYMVAIGQPR